MTPTPALRSEVCCWLEGNKEELKHIFALNDDVDNTKNIDKHIKEMNNVSMYGTHHEVIALTAILEREIHMLSYD